MLDGQSSLYPWIRLRDILNIRIFYLNLINVPHCIKMYCMFKYEMKEIVYGLKIFSKDYLAKDYEIYGNLEVKRNKDKYND